MTEEQANKKEFNDWLESNLKKNSLKKSFDLVKYLVTSLIDQVNMQGCSISCDRVYTLIKLGFP